VKRAAGRGPKAFLWSYHDDKAWMICIHLHHYSIISSLQSATTKLPLPSIDFDLLKVIDQSYASASLS
jgi:hypothetical protein